MSALIIAHYHSDGLLRTDTRRLLEFASNSFEQVFLVSTKLRQSELRKKPAMVTAIIRDNTGYDFWSYREGIVELTTQSFLGAVTLLNTSFLCLKPDVLIKACLSHQAISFSGALLSYEKRPHLQSWALQFGKGIIHHKEIMQWWQNMTPLSDRHQVKHSYEFGISDLMTKLGFSLLPWLNSVKNLDFNVSRVNPSHHGWYALWQELGAIKVELLKGNPYQQDLSSLIKNATYDNDLKALLIEAIGT
jgi:rhamnosyltransferase